MPEPLVTALRVEYDQIARRLETVGPGLAQRGAVKRLGGEVGRRLRRRRGHVQESRDEGARQFAGADQRRVHLPQEADLRRGDRAPLQGDPVGQRQESDALRALLPGPGLPAARDVRGCGDVLPEDPEARTQPDRGLLRAGPFPVVRRQSGRGDADMAGRLQSQQVPSLAQEVPADGGPRSPRTGAPAVLALLALLAQASPPASPTPQAVTVGRVSVVAWPAQAGPRAALADAADRAP